MCWREKRTELQAEQPRADGRGGPNRTAPAGQRRRGRGRRVYIADGTPSSITTSTAKHCDFMRKGMTAQGGSRVEEDRGKTPCDPRTCKYKCK